MKNWHICTKAAQLMDEKTVIAIAIGVIGAIVAQIFVLIVAYTSFQRDRRSKRADEARKQLIAGGDALEKFHWTIQRALLFVTDAGKDASEERSNPKAWQRVVRALEEAREEASTQGTRIAIEFGMDSRVRAEYDRHQDFYRVVADEIIGHREREFRPTGRVDGLNLLHKLGQAEYDNAFIRAASEAARRRDKGKEPEPLISEVDRSRQASSLTPEVG